VQFEPTREALLSFMVMLFRSLPALALLACFNLPPRFDANQKMGLDAPTGPTSGTGSDDGPTPQPGPIGPSSLTGPSGAVTALSVSTLTPTVSLSVTTTPGDLSGWEVCYRGAVQELGCTAVQASIAFDPAPCAHYTAYVRQNGSIVAGLSAEINLEAVNPHRCATRVLGGTSVRIPGVEMFASAPMHTRSTGGVWRLATASEPLLDDAHDLIVHAARFWIADERTIYSSQDGLSWTAAFTASAPILSAGSTASRAYWLIANQAGGMLENVQLVTTADATSFSTITLPGLSSILDKGFDFAVTGMNGRTVVTLSPRTIAPRMKIWTSTDGTSFSTFTNPCELAAFPNALFAPRVGPGFVQLDCDGSGTFELTDGTAWMQTMSPMPAYFRVTHPTVDALFGFKPNSFEGYLRFVSSNAWADSNGADVGGGLRSISIDSVDGLSQTFVSTAGAVLKSADAGVTLAMDQPGERIAALAVGSTRAVAASDAGVIWVSQAGNPSVWSPSFGDYRINNYGVASVTGTILVATAQQANYSIIRRSVDDGLNWADVESLLAITTPAVKGGGGASAPTGYMLACETSSTTCTRSNASGTDPGLAWFDVTRVGLPFSMAWLAGYQGGFVAIGADAQGYWSPNGETWNVSLGSNLVAGNAIDSMVYVFRTSPQIDVFAVDGSASLVQTNLHQMGQAVRVGSRVLFYDMNGGVWSSTDGITFTAQSTLRQKQVGRRGATGVLDGKVILHNEEGEVFVVPPPP
jgi:hypothetical protein